MARKNSGTAKRGTTVPAKAPDAVPSESDQAMRRPNPLELAVPVSEVVQIRNVVLCRSLVDGDSSIFVERRNYAVKIEVPSVEHHIDLKQHMLAVVPSFSLVASRAGNDGPSPVLTIKASFILEYTLPPSVEFEEEQLKAFSMTNGVYNAWPYWREYVQSTTTRMGLPPIIVPVFRLS